MTYPTVLDPLKVGEYPASTKAGGGYVWDAVLEYDEPVPGQYFHVREERITEWPVAFLSRPQRDAFTIPEFLAPDAPSNRLEILRGLAPRSRKC